MNLLPDLSARTAAEVAARLTRLESAGDVAVPSIQWGSNWGPARPPRMRRFHRDYEGIWGHDEYCSDLVLMFFSSLSRQIGQLLALDMVPADSPHGPQPRLRRRREQDR